MHEIGQGGGWVAMGRLAPMAGAGEAGVAGDKGVEPTQAAAAPAAAR